MNIDLRAKRQFLAKAASHYAEVAYLDHLVANELDKRLDVIKFQPNVILNYGAKDNYSVDFLRRRYSEADIFSVEVSENFFELSRMPMNLVAEGEMLPIKKASVDLIFSNLMLHSANEFQKLLLDFRRILKPNGLLFFSMLGRDTLKELRECFLQVSPYPHIHDYFDMHDVGDSLLKNQFSDPVMDMEQITINFSSPLDLIREIKKSGNSNVHLERQCGLMGKKAWKQALDYYNKFAIEAAYPATFEVIYGHAWAPAQDMRAMMNENGEVTFPVHLLKSPR